MIQVLALIISLPGLVGHAVLVTRVFDIMVPRRSTPLTVLTLLYVAVPFALILGG